MPASATYSANPVLALEIDRTGSLTKKTMRLDRDSQLTNSLLQALHPGIRVATIDVPAEPLDPCEQAIVEQALTRIEVEGIRYSLVGASGSAKNGKFYAVESSFEKKLGERFRFSPQAAMTYFGILVSACKVLLEVPDCRVMVVDDREFGTNDCRGWISESLFRKRLSLRPANKSASPRAMRLRCWNLPRPESAASESVRGAFTNFVSRSTELKRKARSRSWRMMLPGILKLTSFCPNHVLSQSTREGCYGRFGRF